MYSSEEDVWARDYDCTMWFECTIVTDVVSDGTDIYGEQVPDFDHFFHDRCDGYWTEKDEIAKKGERVILKGEFQTDVYVEGTDDEYVERTVIADVKEAFKKYLPECTIDMYRTW